MLPVEDRTYMVEFVKISHEGTLLQIREVSDAFRDRPYRWDSDE